MPIQYVFVVYLPVLGLRKVLVSCTYVILNSFWPLLVILCLYLFALCHLIWMGE